MDKEDIAGHGQMVTAANKPEYSLYSVRSIYMATVLGGFLATAILIRKNLINMGKPRKGDQALLIGIVSMIVLLGIIWFLPDNLPASSNMIFPILFGGIAYFVTRKIMGSEIEDHERQGGAYYSPWRACGYALLSAAMILLVIFAVIYVLPEDFDQQAYARSLADFSENEEAALEVYGLLESGDFESAGDFIEEKGIPLWLENIQTLNAIGAMDNLPPELKAQNDLLIEYSQLRVQAYGVIAQSIKENTAAYDGKIEVLHADINEIIERLNQ